MQYDEIVNTKAKYRSVPSDAQSWLNSLDKQALESYERYVMAQFKFNDK